MDARGVNNLSEIWPGFRMSDNIGGNAGAASYGAWDPMLADQRSNHGPPCQKLRRRSSKSGFARGGASTSGSNGSGSSNNNNEGDNNWIKMDPPNENDVDEEEEEGGNTKEKADQATKPAELPKQDYIHVRARRGQATDSHSLAERARREKISERMKILQDLVPGCNKVIGKALVLDEIINYVQSLQRQVELLSMKLEVVNTRTGIDGYPQPKDFVPQQAFDASNMGFASQSTYNRDSSPEWLHMQIGGGGGFERPS